jgi:aspartyl-tRNA(Asn)/glutamyl-tRNA(Gln) amidotransferase subunit C
MAKRSAAVAPDASTPAIRYRSHHHDPFVLPAHPTMALTLADVHRIAHLARIQIDENAAREVHGKLEAIFAMINELQAVDTTGIVPMSHAQDVMLPLREDLVTAADQRELFQSVAPAVENGLYLVPKVIE